MNIWKFKTAKIKIQQEKKRHKTALREILRPFSEDERRELLEEQNKK